MDKKVELVVASLTIASVIVAVLLYTIPLSENQITAIYIFDFIVVILLEVDFYVRIKESGQGLRYLRKNWYEIPAIIPLFVFADVETPSYRRNITQSYQLKWSNEDGLGTLGSIVMNNGQNYNSMLKWLKDTYSNLSKSYGNILLYGTLSGLGPDEVCKSVTLLQKEQDNYLKRDLMVLEHYKYPDIFIRRTKKAYISIVTDSMLELAKQSDACGYNALRLAVKRKKLDMNMAYCRKILRPILELMG